MKLYLGEAKREANKPRIAFGLLKEPDVPELENDEDQDEMEPKRKRKARAIPTRKAKADANAPQPTRIPLIGLIETQLTSADKQDWLAYYKDAESRVKLVGDQQISAVYYSILNSSNGLQPTAVAFSDDSSLCCAGFQDGLVRVFATNSADYLKVLKSREELQEHDLDTLDLDNVLRESDDKMKVFFSFQIFLITF